MSVPPKCLTGKLLLLVSTVEGGWRSRQELAESGLINGLV